MSRAGASISRRDRPQKSEIAALEKKLPENGGRGLKSRVGR